MFKKAFVLLLTAIAVFAWPMIVDGPTIEGTNAVSNSTRFAGGDGSVGNPYQISTATHLQALSSDLTAHYILINDIDASATNTWNSGAGFVPVGDNSADFHGTLDGQGYEITGLFINRGATDYVGLFGQTASSSAISNVGLMDCDITGNNNVGTLAGKIYGTLTRCYSTGDVSGNADCVGGLLGESQNTASYCYSTCTVDGRDQVGGFVGFNGGGGIALKCFATGSVSGTNDVGGFAGWNYKTMTDCYAMGSVTGTTNVGGAIGHIYNSGSTSPVTNCYSTGAVSGTTRVGGFLGYNEQNGVMSKCFWDTQTSGTSTGVASGASGTTVGKNTADMKNNSTFISAGWDYTSIWTQKNGTGYPVLSAFYLPKILTTSIPDVTEDVPYLEVIDVHIFRSIPGVSDKLNFTVESNTDKVSIDNNGNLTGTFLNEDVGIHWVNVTVSRSGYNDSKNLTLAVINTNDAPVINTLDNLSADEDMHYAQRYNATDVDPTNDVLQWTMKTNASWLSFNATTRWLNGTPQNPNVGTYWIYINVSDGKGGMDWTNFTITVGNVNDAPVILTSDDKTATEDYNYLVIYDAVDVDPTLDVLTWSLGTNASWLGIDGVSGALSGTPGDLDAGSFWVNVSVSDGKGGEDFSNFTLDVANVNDAPVITTVPVTVTPEDSLYSLDLDATDVDIGDILTWTKVSGPAWLSMNSSSGLLSGAPSNSEVGMFWIKAEVKDMALASDSIEFMLTVTNTNDAPVWVNHPSDQNLTEAEALLLDAAASDVDNGDEIAYGLKMTPKANMTIDTVSGAMTWISPVAGKYTANVTATDGTATIWYLFNVTVNAVPPVIPPTNHLPVIDPIADRNATVGTQFVLKVTGSDLDALDALMFSLSSAPLGMIISADGTILWIPTESQAGDHNVTVALSDGKNSTFAVFKITVSDAAVPGDDDIDMTTDTDKDGMPDWWETFYGFDPKDSTDAAKDKDNDNITNLDEYKGKTNPTKSDLVPSGDDDDDTDDDTETKDAWTTNNWLYVLLVVAVILLAIIGVLAFQMSRKKEGGATSESESSKDEEKAAEEEEKAEEDTEEEGLGSAEEEGSADEDAPSDEEPEDEETPEGEDEEPADEPGSNEEENPEDLEGPDGKPAPKDAEPEQPKKAKKK